MTPKTAPITIAAVPMVPPSSKKGQASPLSRGSMPSNSSKAASPATA
eukprot:CAMPEP_0172893570 /NCGR_PEP_ID=MMETSP1075-20121228/148820_1 /TAXON_ID=2916 /ORGANISM="Ceratium fusus, Strain PA161109" /LENGTH=46 /DNA_ID= /DNA_START= /DNA_END= /DNA_ORIENTATION=